jgi:glutamyl-tRNA reductase
MTLNPRAIPAKLQRLHHLYLYHIDRLVSRRIWKKNLECRKPRSCNAFRRRNMTRKGWGALGRY